MLCLRNIIRRQWNFICGIVVGFASGAGLVILFFVFLKNEEISPLIKSLSTNISTDRILTDEKLFAEVRIVCLVLTNPKNHYTKAVHVRNTWGKRCNKLLFMSTENDEKLGSIALTNVKESRKHLWLKTRESFKYAYDHHFTDAEWFLKADDDTYIIVENLRRFLKTMSSEEPVYYGCRFQARIKQGFMSGGAGYVLSKEALRRFGEEAYNDAKKCAIDKEEEDVEMGRCLGNVGVKPGDSRDDQGKHRFFPFSPEYHVVPGEVNKDYWYWGYLYYPQEQGLNCCSTTSISFHYITPSKMYELEYMIYHLKKPV